MAETTREVTFTFRYPYDYERVYKIPVGPSVNFDVIKRRTKLLNQELPKATADIPDVINPTTGAEVAQMLAKSMKSSFIDVDDPDTTTEITEDFRVNGIKDIKLTAITTETIYER